MDVITLKTIGNRIKTLRTQKDFTQQQLADAMNLSLSTISLYESGKRKPGISALQKLAKVLGVDPSYFLSEIDDLDEQGHNPRIAKIARDMENLTDEDINFVATIIANLEKNKDGR